MRFEQARSIWYVPRTVWKFATHVANQVANLVPTMARAWGKPGMEGQAFLSTRRDTKWTRMA